jgi:hypothetical protein
MHSSPLLIDNSLHASYMLFPREIRRLSFEIIERLMIKSQDISMHNFESECQNSHLQLE